MQNILLFFCRRTKHYSQKDVANRLGISIDQYRELESGDVLLTYEQARKLGKLYNAETKYFSQAAQHLDLLLTSQANNKLLKANNDQLKERLKSMGEMILNEE